MASRTINKGLKRTALSIALGMAFASTVVLAQSAVGSIYGDAAAGSTVTIDNVNSGQSRDITAGSDGRFTFSQLPPGRYRVTSNGVTREVVVNVGTGTNVNLAATGGAASLDNVTVVGSGAVNAIDVSSVESTTIITEEMVDKLPVGRNVAAVALLAPGTTRSDTFGSNAISFGGASAAENAYYVNGFNVTNIRSGLAYNEVPFEGIAETQVKTGGYGAEFGRSLGGVTNVITKRGTNDWKFSVGALWAPDELRATPYHVENLTPAADRPTTFPNNWALVEADHEREQFQWYASAGGAIVEDRLFIYALYQNDRTNIDTFGVQTITGSRQGELLPTRYNDDNAKSETGLVKIDWNINDNNLLEFTAFRDKAVTNRTAYNVATPWTDSNIVSRVGATKFTTGGDSYVLRWTGYLTDNFTLSALAGDGEYLNETIPEGSNCPYVFDHSTNTQHGCAAASAYGVPGAGDSRRAYRLDGEWVLGDHTFRFGYDQEDIHSIGGSVSSGGIQYDVYAGDDLPDIPAQITVPAGTDYVVVTREFANGGEFDTTNKAWYIEDRWQITDNLLIYGGIRNESFENFNADGITFAKKDNTWAPRLGFSWDVKGDGETKLFGNAGRYFIPIYTNTNVRLSGAELDIQSYYTSNGTYGGGEFDLPNMGTLLGTVVQSDGVAGDPRSVVDNNLSPMFQDEYILGYQTKLSNLWTGGVRAIYRKLASGMDDYCAYQIPHDWALANGYSADEAEIIGNAISACFLTNPGGDLSANIDLDGDGPEGLSVVNIPASVLQVAKVQRTYKAVEFFFERAWDDKWTMQGSYTWSKSVGNSEGYIDSELGQADAGISADFDFAEFTEYAYGYLPNDRRHTIKLFGAYKLNDEWQFGMNVNISSGRPRSCMGAYNGPIDPPDPTLYPGYAFYCDSTPGVDAGADGIPDGQPVPRGTFGRTEWQRNVGLQIAYLPQWLEGLKFTVNVFNIFNENTITSYKSRSLPNDRFQQPLTWQAPRSIQLQVSYDWGFKDAEVVAAPAPAPAPAPAKTCADLDDDGDGINNCNDKCPASPAGSAVGADGCPVPAEPVMEPKPYRN